MVHSKLKLSDTPPPHPSVEPRSYDSTVSLTTGAVSLIADGQLTGALHATDVDLRATARYSALADIGWPDGLARFKPFLFDGSGGLGALRCSLRNAFGDNVLLLGVAVAGVALRASEEWGPSAPHVMIAEREAEAAARARRAAATAAAVVAAGGSGAPATATVTAAVLLAPGGAPAPPQSRQQQQQQLPSSNFNTRADGAGRGGIPSTNFNLKAGGGDTRPSAVPAGVTATPEGVSTASAAYAAGAAATATGPKVENKSSKAAAAAATGTAPTAVPSQAQASAPSAAAPVPPPPTSFDAHPATTSNHHRGSVTLMRSSVHADSVRADLSSMALPFLLEFGADIAAFGLEQVSTSTCNICTRINLRVTQ